MILDLWFYIENIYVGGKFIYMDGLVCVGKIINNGVFIYVGPESLSKSEHAARPKKPNLSGGSEIGGERKKKIDFLSLLSRDCRKGKELTFYYTCHFYFFFLIFL